MIHWTWERDQWNPLEASIGRYHIEIYPYGDTKYIWDSYLAGERWAGVQAHGESPTLEEAMANAKTWALDADGTK
jgi:hypothetical protein